MTGWLAVVNATAGGRTRSSRRIASVVDQIRPLMRTTVFSAGPGDARRLARAADSYSGIVAIGGDGTLLEILNGIDGRRQQVAIMPAGRGNSLARDLALRDFASAVEALRRRDSVAIDLAEVILRDARGVESRIISASTIALGYVVAVTTIANRMRGLGRYCYAVAAVIATRRLIRATLEIAYDDGARSRHDLTGLIVNNTRHVANFVPFPEADCTDGYLDVMELRAGCVGQNAHNLFAMRGLTYPAAPIRRVRRLAIVLAQPQSVMIDGEIYQDIAELSVRVMPRALECLCRAAA